jgi:Domain of unknown function
MGLRETTTLKNEDENDFLKNMNGWLMTVATLLMNIWRFKLGWTYQGDLGQIPKPLPLPRPIHKPGQPIIMNTDTIIYILFLVFDVIACGLSISIIILLLYKKHPEHMHRFVKIRLLLVYNMSMIALAYIVGCAYIAKSAIPDEEALIQTEQGLHIDYIRRDAELKVRASGNTMWCMQTASN